MEGGWRFDAEWKVKLPSLSKMDVKKEGIDDPLIVELGASYVAEKYPFTSAISWIENNRLLDICLNDGFDACCYKINGGWNGYEKRIDLYERCRRYMV